MLPKSNNGGTRRVYAEQTFANDAQDIRERRWIVFLAGSVERPPTRENQLVVSTRDRRSLLRATFDSRSRSPFSSRDRSVVCLSPRKLSVKFFFADIRAPDPRSEWPRGAPGEIRGTKFSFGAWSAIVAIVRSSAGEARARIVRFLSRPVRNNLLNYRMPKVTSARREAGVRGGVLRGVEKGTSAAAKFHANSSLVFVSRGCDPLFNPLTANGGTRALNADRRSEYTRVTRERRPSAHGAVRYASASFGGQRVNGNRSTTTEPRTRGPTDIVRASSVPSLEGPS